MISRRSFIGALATAAGALVAPELLLPSGKKTFVFGTGVRELPSPLFIWGNPGEFYNAVLREVYGPALLGAMEREGPLLAKLSLLDAKAGKLLVHSP